MMKKILILAFSFLAHKESISQEKAANSKIQWIDLAVTAGNSQGAVAASYVHNWKIGKKKRLEAGIGARLTSVFGEKLTYITAPANLARANTHPFLIVFADQQIDNWDTLTVQMPLTNSLNLTANFGYNFSKRWGAGFNIDLIGFTFGKKSAAILTSNGTTRTEPVAKPAGFNVLLTGDLDYGSLNSEFFLKYNLNDRWTVRGVYQFLFTEYKTNTILQTAPDGTTVNRFRNKANNLGVGLSYNF